MCPFNMRKLYKILLAVLLVPFVLKADPNDDFKRIYPSVRSLSNVGCEFYFTVPPALTDGTSLTDYVYVVVSSEFDTDVTLSIPSRNYNEIRTIARGESEIFELNPEEAQLYLKSGYDLTVSSFQKENGAIILNSEKPVSAKVLIDYRDSQEGFLLYPTSVMGTQYSVSTYNDGSGLYSSFHSFPTYVAIISLYDNNIITFNFDGQGSGGGINKGAEKVKQIGKGDVWLIASQGVTADLSGSYIESEHPIVVISGCQSANIPVENKWHNYIVEQEIPMRFWGKKYHVSALNNRKYNPVLRIVGDFINQDSVVKIFAFYDKNESEIGVDTLLLSEETCKYGSNFIEYRPKHRYVTLKSESTFFVSYYNTGVEEDGAPQPKGSPFQMNLTSIENYGKGAIFSIDKPLDRNNTNRYYMQVYIKDYEANEKKIKIGTFLDDKVIYNDIFDEKIIDFHIMPDENGVTDAYLFLELSHYGTYMIDSEYEFTAYMYVLTTRESIGYQAVMSMSNLHSEDKYKPEVTVKENCPGQIDGRVCDMPDDDSKRINLSTAIFENMENFERVYIDPITAGETRCADWSLRVKNPYKNAHASVLFRDLVGNDTVCNFTYTPPEIDMYPKYQNYGTAAINQIVKREFTFVNTSDTEIFDLDSIAIKMESTNFYITGAMPSVKLQPGEEYRFEVYFESGKGGIFIDSVGVGNACFFKYFSKVEAVIGQPIINVVDVDFNAIEVGKKAEVFGSIINTGVSNLIIDGWKQFGDEEFTPIFNRDISQSNPLIIKPNNSFKFTLECSPVSEGDYSGRIVFSSNAKSIDSVCVFEATGVTVGLVAESYDYGRKRINRPEYPIIPYRIKNDKGGIILKNVGKTELTILQVKEIESQSGEAFELNKNELRNLVISQGNEFGVPVYFNPKDVGEYKLVLSYEVEGQDELSAETILKGVGIAPKIEIKDVDFGTVLQSNNHITKTMTITNLTNSQWQWADSCRVYDISDVEQGTISFTPWVFGSENFSIDKGQIDFSKPILPGESLSFDVNFLPFREGRSEAYLKIISDAYNVLEPIKITGFVVSNDIEFYGGSTDVCRGESSIISGQIVNNTNAGVEFIGLSKLNDFAESDFRLVDDRFVDDFVIDAGESVSVDLEYTSPGEMNQTISIQLKDKTGFYEKTAIFSGRNKKINRSLAIAPVSRKILPGAVYEFDIDLDAGESISEYGLTELIIEFFYDSDIISIRQEDISLNPDLKNRYDYVIEKMEDSFGYIKVKMYSINGDSFDKNGKLFTIHYKALLPTEDIDGTDITVMMETPSSTCVEFSNGRTLVSFDDFCASDFRNIEFSDSPLELTTISPNPVVRQAEIGFSLVFESDIELKIYSLTGTFSHTILDDTFSAGKHIIEQDFSDFASGVYLIVLKTSHGSSYKKIQILQ